MPFSAMSRPGSCAIRASSSLGAGKQSGSTSEIWARLSECIGAPANDLIQSASTIGMLRPRMFQRVATTA